MQPKIFLQLIDLVPELTAHGKGYKQVFLNNNDTATSITQVAYGKFLPGESCPSHVHTTMEECFYFISGAGEYVVDGKSYELKEGSFIRIPAATTHQLKALGNEPLTFVYFGVAV